MNLTIAATRADFHRATLIDNIQAETKLERSDAERLACFVLSDYAASGGGPVDAAASEYLTEGLAARLGTNDVGNWIFD